MTPEHLRTREHDLRASLAVIVGYAELLRTRDDEPTRREAPGRIAEAADRLSASIDALFEELRLELARRPPA